jgi:hypothetical protein
MEFDHLRCAPTVRAVERVSPQTSPEATPIFATFPSALRPCVSEPTLAERVFTFLDGRAA